MEVNAQRKNQFLRAFDDLSNALFRHAYYRVFDRELAKDLVQEAFIKTWQQLEGSKAEILAIKPFLYRVLNNLIIDHARKHKEESLDVLLEQGFDPSAPYDESQFTFLEAEKALQELSRLPSPYREVVVMRYLDELGPKEIAELIHESENVISVRLNRAVKILRQAIGKDSYENPK